ncbi:MAG: carbohydrate kinase [Clostridiales Family XIII bacterium]|nr:carbohydrate kinase [Clostridiales Family XIII bacterium]
MNKANFLGIDFGTQGVRCGIFDQTGAAVSVREEKYPTYYPKPGYAEQAPGDWLASMDRALDGCYSEAGDAEFALIRGITICTTSSTVIPVSESGESLGNAILWMDNRSVAQVKRINDTNHGILKYCGGEDSVEWIVPKMMWIRDNRPDIFSAADRIVEFQDFINHYLTGRWCASVSQVTCKAHYVESLGGFNKDFYHAIGFNEFFEKADLDVVNQGAPIGEIRSELSDRYHIPKDAVIYQGGIDAHINVIGLGVCSAGESGVVMGSSFVQLTLSELETFEDGIWGPYKAGVLPDLYCLEGGQVSAGSITKWFVKEFKVEGENPYLTMAEEAEKIPIGSDGVVMLDFFQGNRTPYKDPKAKGVFYGLTLSHTRGHLYRALLEGVAFGTHNILELMERGGNKITMLRGCGGVTLNRLWLQIISDVTGKPITLTEQSGNAGMLGCAICVAVGSGHFSGFKQAADSMVRVTEVIEPNMDDHGLYRENFKKYLAVYQNLKNV